MNLQTLPLNLMTTLVLVLGLTACDLGEKQIGDEGTDSGDGDGDTESGDGDGDTESGDGDGDGDGDGSGDGDGEAIGPCGEETLSSLPSNPDTYFADPLDAFGGRSVDDILAIVEGNYAGMFTWGPVEGVVLIDHLGTESPLTITATFAGGDATLTEVALAGEWLEGEPFPTLCTNRLEFDVTLDFATADGVFDESLLVHVGVNSHVEPADDGDPMFQHHLDLDAQQGSLAFEDFEVVDGMLTDLVLIAGFGEAGINGAFNAEVLTMDWVGYGSIATFEAQRLP